MVLILDGISKVGAHERSDFIYLICLRHLNSHEFDFFLENTCFPLHVPNMS